MGPTPQGEAPRTYSEPYSGPLPPSGGTVAPGHGSMYVQPGFGLTGLDASAGVRIRLPARLAFSAGG